jgi:hypothetical protein
MPPARTTFKVKWWPPKSSVKPLPVALLDIKLIRKPGGTVLSATLPVVEP